MITLDAYNIVYRTLLSKFIEDMTDFHNVECEILKSDDLNHPFQLWVWIEPLSNFKIPLRISNVDIEELESKKLIDLDRVELDHLVFEPEDCGEYICKNWLDALGLIYVNVSSDIENGKYKLVKVDQ